MTLTALEVDATERQRLAFVEQLRHHVERLHAWVAVWEPAPCPER